MALLIITTILWAFSFSFYGEYLAGHVDSYFAVLVRVGLAALVFLPFLRTRGNSLKTVGLYMLVGAMQLGVMYMLSFRAYLYLTVSELLLFTVLTPLYITLIYDIMSKRRLRWGYASRQLPQETAVVEMALQAQQPAVKITLLGVQFHAERALPSGRRHRHAVHTARRSNIQRSAGCNG